MTFLLTLTEYYKSITQILPNWRLHLESDLQRFQSHIIQAEDHLLECK
jgi:hypothetical protein